MESTVIENRVRAGGRRGYCAILLATALLAGCATERDWKQAQQTNAVSAYRDFLARHPKSSHASEAHAAIEELDWQAARNLNSASGYDAFLHAHPDGRHSSEAKNLEETAQWGSLKNAEPLSAYTDFYSRFPSSSHLEKISGNITASPMLPFGHGLGFTVRGTVSLDVAVASIQVNGRDIGFNPPIDDAGQLGLVEYRRHGNSADVAEKSMKNATLIVLKGPDQAPRIVAVTFAGP
jgi:hypothetical protein